MLPDLCECHWDVVRSYPSSAESPQSIDWSDALEARVPGTVAELFEDSQTTSYDDHDWWYRAQFEINDVDADRFALELDGLATLAEVWLNDRMILASDNMFEAHMIDVSEFVSNSNTLVIAFRSLTSALQERRPRPAWKTNLVSHQQLRWFRTTLLGRIPGWASTNAAVGPWRPIRIVGNAIFDWKESSVVGRIADGSSFVHANLALHDQGVDLDSLQIQLSVADNTVPLETEKVDGRLVSRGVLKLSDVPAWNVGDNCASSLVTYNIDVVQGNQRRTIKTGRTGFRSVKLDRADGAVRFMINDQPIFARGGCWSTNDIRTLVGSKDRLRKTLRLLKASGMNFIRVGGTMVYESEEFYDACDELGIAVWQDFMFANMDYPTDTTFVDSVRREVTQQLRRLSQHPCVIAYCGNSEVEQQAAMFGLSKTDWENELFYKLIPDEVAKFAPQTPYFPSSPCEGSLPFHSSTGVSHYFGVGAYKQGFRDLALSDVKFASECLAFSNVPSSKHIRRHFSSSSPPTHHPHWKSGVPRDSSAGWDFEDIRDHYLERLYDLDPVALRYADRERYTRLSQVVTGEVMQVAFDYWQGKSSSCNGALIWFLNDIAPGAGWGLIDSDGEPKPIYYLIKRSWSQVRLHTSDAGMNGPSVHLCNDSESPYRSRLDVRLLQNSHIEIAKCDFELEVAPNSTSEHLIDDLLQRFFDSAYRYRFGPPKHDVISVACINEDGNQDLTTCFFPGSRNLQPVYKPEIDIQILDNKHSTEVQIQSDCFLQFVELTSTTHHFDDNHFHLAPGQPRTIKAIAKPGTEKPLRGKLRALNLLTDVLFNR